MYEDNDRYGDRRSSRSTSARSTRDSRSSSQRRRGSSERGRSTRAAASGSSRNGSSGRQTRDRSQNRRPNGARNTAARRGLGISVPLLVCIPLLLVSILASVGLTRCAMKPQIDAAKKEAKDLRAELATVKQEVDRYRETDRSAAAAASTTGVDSPWISTGKFTTGDTTLDGEVKEFCDSHATQDMSKEDAVLEVYKAIAWSEYYERDDAQHPAGKDWRIEYARKYYEHDCSGNCYEFACFLMYCMRYMGYEDALAEGVEIEFESGSWGDHGIVFVTNTDGTPSLLDTARGLDGWMLSTDVYNYKIVDFENA